MGRICLPTVKMLTITASIDRVAAHTNLSAR